MIEFNLDGTQLEDLLNSPDGPVGRMLEDLAREMATRARVFAPIRHERGGDSRPIGYTKANIRARTGRYKGTLYGSATAPADPAVFLEHPAEQLKQKEPFLTTALWSLEGLI